MSLINWPFKRKQYSGLTNPLYVSDIVAANEAVIDAMKSMGGFAASGFAILSGMVYDSGAHTYTAGVFYLNGSFYSIAAFNEGVYLIGGSTDIKISPFPDTTTKPIYTSFAGTTTSNPSGASPIFSGNMDLYRLNLSKLKTDLVTVQTFLGTLGNSATKNVGTTAGTVAAGDASYTKEDLTTSQKVTAYANKHADVDLQDVIGKFNFSLTTLSIKISFSNTITSGNLLFKMLLPGNGSDGDIVAYSTVDMNGYNVNINTGMVKFVKNGTYIECWTVTDFHNWSSNNSGFNVSWLN
jgi:hypothetical protein